MKKKRYWERKHRLNILKLVIEKAGDTGMTPTQIYDQMNVGVQYNVIAKIIAVLYRSGFLSRCVLLGVDARVYKYRATKQGHEVYLSQSFDEASRLERPPFMIFKVAKR